MVITVKAAPNCDTLYTYDQMSKLEGVYYLDNNSHLIFIVKQYPGQVVFHINSKTGQFIVASAEELGTYVFKKFLNPVTVTFSN